MLEPTESRRRRITIVLTIISTSSTGGFTTSRRGFSLLSLFAERNRNRLFSVGDFGTVLRARMEFAVLELVHHAGYVLRHVSDS